MSIWWSGAREFRSAHRSGAAKTSTQWVLVQRLLVRQAGVVRFFMISPRLVRGTNSRRNYAEYLWRGNPLLGLMPCTESKA